jgi:predicted DNA-binding antitoxin AbrB/MazE fold protein
MDREQDIPFVYEDGVLKPEGKVDLPAGTRGIAHVSQNRPRAEAGALAWTPEIGRAAMDQIRRLAAEGVLNSGGEKLSREQMHERR